MRSADYALLTEHQGRAASTGIWATVLCWSSPTAPPRSSTTDQGLLYAKKSMVRSLISITIVTYKVNDDGEYTLKALPTEQLLLLTAVMMTV